jgi:GNAT superfamily N-acetyltransferase
MEISFSEYLISTDKSKLNIDVIFNFLSRSYWANHRPIETIIKSIDHSSLCFGVYHGTRQIGFARIVTDLATMYWLCDVFIDEEYRGKGIGKKLIETIVDCDELQGLNGILGTADAHGLYDQFGFVVNPGKAMIRKAR